MKKILAVLISLCFLASANAGEYENALKRCVSNSVTENDKAVLARWVVAGLGHHPEIKPLFTISPERLEEINQEFGQVNNRLLIDACGKELREAIQFEGKAAAKSSFAALGEIAMQEMMTNQSVVESLWGAAKYIDLAKINSVINSK